MNHQMTPPLQSETSPAERLEQTRQRFATAWSSALAGGPPPSLDTFLNDHLAEERTVARQSLETIDREFRNRWNGSAHGSSRGGARTVVVADGPCQTTPPAGDATILLDERSSDQQPLTMRMSPAAKDSDTIVLAEKEPPESPTVMLTPSDASIARGDELPTIELDGPTAAAQAKTAPRDENASAATQMFDEPGPAAAGDGQLLTLPLPESPDGESASAGENTLAMIQSSDDGTQLLDDTGQPVDDAGQAAASSLAERPSVAGYEILGELGRGGMGVVYRARHLKLDREVALKMVLTGAHAGEENRNRFYAEAQAVAQVQHPNIVQIFEVGEQAGLPYFALEFITGQSLSQKMAGKPQPDRDAAAMIETLARAMHHAHEHGIVHRDLKPANVLLSHDGTPKITDFGLAKRLEGESSSQTRSGAILGTPSYMAPEQAMGEVHQIGSVTDVYALGAMLYEMITGRPPFLAATPMDTVMQVARDEPLAPSQLQPTVARDLETICLKCLQKERGKRYSTAAALADDLRRFQHNEPITARPVSRAERLARWCRRNPNFAALNAVIALLIVAGLAGAGFAYVRIKHEKDDAVAARQTAETSELAAKAARNRAELAEDDAKRSEQIAMQNAELATANAKLASDQTELALDALKTVVTEVDADLRDKPAMRPLRT